MLATLPETGTAESRRDLQKPAAPAPASEKSQHTTGGKVATQINRRCDKTLTRYEMSFSAISE
jgi:hypothetical protein